MSARPTVAEVLAACLARVEAGESVSAVLADHPDHAPEIRPLLLAALAVRAHRPSPTPAFRAALQQRLAESAPVPQRNHRSSGHTWRVWLLRAAATGAAVVATFSGLAVASADSRPGDPLYVVRRGVERVQEVAERVAPPIGRAIDYLTIRTISDGAAPAAPATPSPTAALAPGSSVLEVRPRAARPRTAGDDGAGGVASATADGMTAAEAAAVRARLRPNPAARPVDRGPASERADGATPPATAIGTAGFGAERTAEAVGTLRAEPTATPSPKHSQTPVRPTASPVAQEPPATAPGGISGQVMGREGIGIPGALVSVYAIGDDGAPLWSQRFSARTREDGSFAFTRLAPGRYKLAVGELAPWVWRVWYRDTLYPQSAEAIVVEPGRITPDVDTRLLRNPWLLGGREPIGRPPRH